MMFRVDELRPAWQESSLLPRSAGSSSVGSRNFRKFRSEIFEDFAQFSSKKIAPVATARALKPLTKHEIESVNPLISLMPKTVPSRDHCKSTPK
jgi:hypothetical protein